MAAARADVTRGLGWSRGQCQPANEEEGDRQAGRDSSHGCLPLRGWWVECAPRRRRRQVAPVSPL